MRTILLLVSVFLMDFVFAEPRRLVCSYTDLKGLETTVVPYPHANVDGRNLPIGSQIRPLEAYCGVNPDMFSELCYKSGELKKFRDTGTCKTLGYLSKNVFTIETSNLNTTVKSNAEFFSENCGQTWAPGFFVGVSSSGIKQVTMTATPSLISFSGAHSATQVFNIDRKTLRGGYTKDRSYQCKLEDVDTSENLI